MRVAYAALVAMVVVMMASLTAANGTLSPPSSSSSSTASPTKSLKAVLGHSRDNVAEAQRDANEEYKNVKKACEEAIEEIMDEVRPLQNSLLSTATLMRDRRLKIKANNEAVRMLNTSIDLLGGRVETLGLRMSHAVRERRETHTIAAQKVEDTRRLIDSVSALMSSVSNAHVRLNATVAQELAAAAAAATRPASLLETAAEPTPVAPPAAAAPAASASPLASVEGSFKLLNLLRHELSQYAVEVPKQQAEAQVTFERLYSHLNESYYHAREEYRAALKHRREAVEENQYLREWLARTRATLPDLRQRLRVLQRELRQAIRECEEARSDFRDASADRKRELETLTTVERIVTSQLTDADFLPPPPSPAPGPQNATVVAEKPDPDLERPTNNTDAKPAPKPAPKPSTERNIIYG